MTAQTTDVYSGNLRAESSDEIDLRRYLLVLARWWREILAISILAGVITGIAIALLNSNRTPTYAANADIVIARLLSTIELDTRVNTSSASNQGDPMGWRVSLLQLAKSGVVADAVLADLGDKLPASLQTPQALIEVIEAAVPFSEDERFPSNLIRITATTADPELSALIANTWVRYLVTYINGLYGEVPESVIESVTAERDEALRAFQEADAAWQEFIANNRNAELVRQIEEKTTLRNELMLNYTRMLTSIVSAEYNARLSLYDTLISTPVTHAQALIQAQSNGNVRSLDSLYELRASAVAHLNQARLMEQSLVDGGEAAAKSNVSALQMLKLATFATMHGDEAAAALVSTTAPDIEMTLEEQLADVRALVTVLEAHITQLEADITQLAESTMIGAELARVGGLESGAADAEDAGDTVVGPAVTTAYAELLGISDVLEQVPIEISSEFRNSHEELLSQLETEIRELEAAKAAEDTRQRQLSHQRDLAWTTYETVGNKLQELELLRSSANSEVRLGNPAVPPTSPEPNLSPVIPAVAIALLAFLGAIILALLVDSLGGGPFFARRPA